MDSLATAGWRENSKWDLFLHREECNDVLGEEDKELEGECGGSFKDEEINTFDFG